MPSPRIVFLWGIDEPELDGLLVGNFSPLYWLLLLLRFDNKHFDALLGLTYDIEDVHGVVGMS